MAEINEVVIAAKVCENCGDEFGCGANSETCWCSAIDVSPERAEKLKAKFTDCLCPRCLENKDENSSSI